MNAPQQIPMIRTPSGRWMMNLVGLEFHNLLVLRQSDKKRVGHTYWDCECLFCHRVVPMASHWLRGPSLRSCGCKRTELISIAHTTHGQSGYRRAKRPPTAEYRCWTHILTRCTNQNARGYENYGGRGIKVCERWQGEDGFERFLADMGPRPSGKHSIDRFPNNNGDYEPSNCRWATRRQQAQNTRRNRLLTVGTETKCLAEWARQSPVSIWVIRKRLAEGWSAKAALGIN